MTKDDLWKIYTSKNPQFLKDGNVTLSTAGLKKLFDQAYDQGFKQCQLITPAVEGLFDKFFKK